jgi:hypothetical protein
MAMVPHRPLQVHLLVFSMEATGVYWMPVWNVLEAYGLQLLLNNPEHYKVVRREGSSFWKGRTLELRCPKSSQRVCALFKMFLRS